jgi:hypothetical protein
MVLSNQFWTYIFASTIHKREIETINHQIFLYKHKYFTYSVALSFRRMRNNSLKKSYPTHQMDTVSRNKMDEDWCSDALEKEFLKFKSFIPE